MLSIFIAAILGFAAFVSLGLWGRRRPDAIHRDPLVGALLAEPQESLLRLVQSVLAGMGMTSSVKALGRDGVDLLAERTGALGPEKLYVRVATPRSGWVDQSEVQAAMDTARWGYQGRAILICPGEFSSAARHRAAGEALELVDGPRLVELARERAPDALPARLRRRPPLRGGRLPV